MENIFITGIQIEKYRNIENLDIRLSQNERQHLIITGKNGSGKTSLLDLIVSNFDDRFKWLHNNPYETTTNLYTSEYFLGEKNVGSVLFSKEANRREVLMINLSAEHLFRALNSPENLNLKNRYIDLDINNPKISVSQNMLQTMVTMRIQQLEAKENNDVQLYLHSEKWFNVLKKVLCTIYENQTLDLKYIPQEYDYRIILDGHEFNLNQMADGFSAFFRIVSEIMEKMDYYTG